MELGSSQPVSPRMEIPGLERTRDYSCLEARAQAFEEAVSMALLAAAWLQHSKKDPRASEGAQAVARLLAACSGQPLLHGPDSFAAARRFLEEGHD